MNETTIDTLREAVRDLHGCDSLHVESVAVTEIFHEQTGWDGQVEVFDLICHPTAERVYAWAHETDEGRTRFVAVLHEGPVDSPQAAVRAAVAAESKERDGDQ